MRRIISLLAMVMLMALMVAASGMPAFAQGPPRPPGPPTGKAPVTIIECGGSGVAIITPNGMTCGACASR